MTRQERMERHLKAAHELLPVWRACEQDYIRERYGERIQSLVQDIRRDFEAIADAREMTEAVAHWEYAARGIWDEVRGEGHFRKKGGGNG